MISVAIVLSWLAGQTTPPAKPSTWSISPNNVAQWNQEPYIPLGIVSGGTQPELDRAKTAGIQDLLVHISMDQDWNAAVARLETGGFRYLLEVNSLAPTAQGMVIEPEAYRIPGITGPIQGDLSVQGASEALVVLVTQRDGSIQKSERRPVINGLMKLDIDPQSELEHVLLVYPLVTEARIPDYWSEFDQHRDQLLSKLRKLQAGPGFRGLVNPMGNVVQFPNPKSQFVPTSPLFRMEVEQFLRRKYTTLTSALKSWSITAPDFDGFQPLSRLVPLWSAQRGVPYLYDPLKDRIYKVDQRQSVAWRDLQEVLYTTAVKRYQRLVSAIKTVTNVPIIQTWDGWTGPYEDRSSGLEGIGVRLTEKSRAGLTDEASRAASSLLRWNRPGWFVVNRLPVEPSDLGLLADVLGDLESLGARGVYVDAQDDTVLQAIANEAKSRNRAALASWKPSALFFPESALNPALPSPLPGGRWWLPAPMEGNRIDLGPLYGAYLSREAGEAVMVIWANEMPRRTKLISSDPKSLTFPTMNPEDLKPKVGRNWVEITIPTTPMVIRGASDVPIPEDALLDSKKQMESLLQQAERRLGTAAEDRLSFDEAVQSMDRSPGAGYLEMRRQILGLSYRLSDAIWLEAEGCRNLNWSEARQTSGCSSGSALYLQGRLPSGPSGYFATFDFDARMEGDYQIWIAARLTKDELAKMTLRIGDQVLRPERGPLSMYGQRFGWYSFGTRSLVRGRNQITVRVDTTTPVDIALDVVLLSPRPFRPNGVQPPGFGAAP